MMIAFLAKIALLRKNGAALGPSINWAHCTPFGLRMSKGFAAKIVAGTDD
jgi:hypothetical protein